MHTIRFHSIQFQVSTKMMWINFNLQVLEDLDTEFKGTEQSQSNDSNVQEAENEGENEMV